MKTYSVKPDDIKRKTHVIDATDQVLGRVATDIATKLMGKHKAMFSRNADTGDCVTVLNAAKVRVTGKKTQQKMYYRHSNYPGGFKQTTYEKMMEEHPERIITFAVDGMLPKNHLHDKMMKRLKVFAGEKKVAGVEAPEEVKIRIKKAEIKYIPIKVDVKGKKEKR
ncbi:MAG: 50S ribosomal protein L13 [Dehalococcoidales bacterium]|nr:50S ribosomal protein L13 [Dehalococcoidales bacterium]